MGTGQQFPGRTVHGGKRGGAGGVHNIIGPGNAQMMGNPGRFDIQYRAMDRLKIMAVGHARFEFCQQPLLAGRPKGNKFLNLVQMRPDFRIIIFQMQVIAQLI